MPTTMTVVAHATTLNHRVFVCLPISCLLFTSFSMKYSTNGSRTPFSTWLRIDILISGKLGIRTTAAPATISSV